MLDIDTNATLLGFAVGLPMAVVFFLGLNFGMRLALASQSPGFLLMLSFFIRLAVLLAVGFAIVNLTDTLWSLAGYMLAFLLVRIVAVMRAQLQQKVVNTKQEGT
ncbi:ATP synthase subunit AtpR [Pseudomonas sp. C27(2019)]|uniref:N-ATPase subunit AtpR n=1 Tax=Pseudomonas sp. C27(2019) TaxID=2604941 RepID=UPI00124489D6|nr:ATP synthase subunit I [Pseudomonas sp. C27(2019)]QEY59195.1 ATP synthase subunit AtpR [Pseudomonas sp. C27(2019)]